MMSGRGQEDRQGAVKIKVERIPNQGRARGGVYEDEVVYVTEGPKRRGRPKKPASTPRRPPPQPLPQRYPRSVTPIVVGGRPQYVIPPRGSALRQAPRCPETLAASSRPIAVCAAVCPRSIRCVVSGVGVASAAQAAVTVAKPVAALGPQRVCNEISSPVCHQPTKIDWPEDLQDLVDNWDNLPERRTRDVVKWFQAPNGRCEPPKIVQEIQDMWNNMPETWAEKVDLALDWLQDGDPQSSSQQPNIMEPETIAKPSTDFVLQQETQGNSSNGAGSDSNCSTSQLMDVATLANNRAKQLS